MVREMRKAGKGMTRNGGDTVIQLQGNYMHMLCSSIFVRL